jgi:hypothetical protein
VNKISKPFQASKSAHKRNISAKTDGKTKINTVLVNDNFNQVQFFCVCCGLGFDLLKIQLWVNNLNPF